MNDKFEYIDGNWVCPKCGCTKITIHSGMFVDRFVCLNCNYESHV